MPFLLLREMAFPLSGRIFSFDEKNFVITLKTFTAPKVSGIIAFIFNLLFTLHYHIIGSAFILVVP